MSERFSYSLALFQANRLYTNYFCQYGETAQGVHWRNEDTQRLRFQLLCEFLSVSDWGLDSSINDFGCGYGALWKYLQERGYRGSYTGYDMNASMITTAKQRYPATKASFVKGKTILATAQYTIISGTFNLKMNASDKVWWKYIQEHLTMAWQHSSIGLTFNLLERSISRNPLQKLFYCDRDTLLGFCHKLTDNVEWKIAGSIGDIHVYLRK